MLACISTRLPLANPRGVPCSMGCLPIAALPGEGLDRPSQIPLENGHFWAPGAFGTRGALWDCSPQNSTSSPLHLLGEGRKCPTPCLPINHPGGCTYLKRRLMWAVMETWRSQKINNWSRVCICSCLTSTLFCYPRSIHNFSYLQTDFQFFCFILF